MANKPLFVKQPKRLKDPAKFLMDNGLLFEINRSVLHPFGLALEVQIDDETGKVTLGGVWDYRTDNDGLRYTDGAFVDGAKKFDGFLKRFGLKRMRSRKKLLGYVRQGEE